MGDDLIGPPLEDGSWGLPNTEGWWVNISAFVSSAWAKGWELYGRNQLYVEAQRYLGLLLLGYITYKVFK